MRLFIKLIARSKNKEVVNLNDSFIGRVIDECAKDGNRSNYRMKLFNSRGRSLLEISTYIRSTWVQNDGNHEYSYNKLTAYVRVCKRGARLLGVMLDAPLYNENTKKSIEQWETDVSAYVDKLDSKIKTMNLLDKKLQSD